MKTKVIKKWLISKSIKDIQSFLCFTNFYKKFIRQYLKIAVPLFNLTKKKQKFEQILEKKEAFLTLEDIFIKGLVLAIFNPAKKIIVETDASKIALGAILNQLDEKDRLYPAIFYSKKFTAPELNYNKYDKKLLAIINNFKI